MDIYLLILSFILGITLGSFFNVVALRLPKGEIITTDRSRCTHCGEQLRWFELIPLISYLIQKGSCRYCKQKLSAQYIFAELFTGLLFAYSYLQIGLDPELILALLLISLLIIITVTDFRYMLIPNQILFFFFPLFITLRIILPLDPWYNAILGSIVGFILIALIILASRGGMGAGDMKLFAVIGVVLGLGKTLLTLFIASVIGLNTGFILILAGRLKRKQAIPFGPYIAVAALLSYYFGDEMIEIYLEGWK